MSPSPTVAPPSGLAVELPEPGRSWVRYRPRYGHGGRGWPGPPGGWVDLASGRLAGWGGAQEVAPFPDLGDEALDDVLYLPPVRPALRARLDREVRRRQAAGTPVLVQLAPGEPGVDGAVLVVDLLAPLLGRDLASLPPAPSADAAAVWPLLPGLTDEPELWRSGCERLATAGFRTVLAVRPTLDPGDRRRLTELGGGGAFDALFHREAPPERAFAREAHRFGLAPFLPRPLPHPPVSGIANRRLAGLLAQTGELLVRLGEGGDRSQAFFRAAREVDRTAWDLQGLERDGNLEVLEWLDDEPRRLVREALAGTPPALLAELMAEYLGEEAP